MLNTKPRKIEENKWESRNIGFGADMKFNFFFTANLKVYSEVKPSPAELVSGWVTQKYTTCCQKHRTKNSILTLKNAD